MFYSFWVYFIILKIQILLRSRITKYNFRPEHRFWARTLTCCLYAGKIAAGLKLLPEALPPDVIIDWAVRQLTLEADGTARYQVKESAVDVLVEYLSSHLNEMLIVAGPWDWGRSEMNPILGPKGNVLSVRFEQQGQIATIAVKSLAGFLSSKNYPTRSFLGELEKERIMIKRGMTNLGAGTVWKVAGNMDTIKVDMSNPKLSGGIALVRKAEERVA